jgi:hypothetical protein
MGHYKAAGNKTTVSRPVDSVAVSFKVNIALQSDINALLIFSSVEVNSFIRVAGIADVMDLYPSFFKYLEQNN